MVLITILTLALALLPVTEKVNAVAAEMAVVYFVYATIFGSCAVSFATDDNFRQGVKKFVGQASEVTKNIVNAKAVEMANNIASGLQIAGYKISFSAEEWKFITEDVNKYVSNAYNSLDSSAITVGKDGTLGWTKNSQFTVALAGGISQIALNDYTILTFRSADLKQNIFGLMPYTNNDFLNSQNSTVYSCSYTFSATPFSLIYYSAQETASSKFKYNGLLTSYTEATYNSMNELRCTHSNAEFGSTAVSLLSQCTPSEKYTKMYTINGQVCYFVRCADRKYRFVTLDYLNNSPAVTDDNCVPLINHYTNKTYYSFDTACEMYYTILDACKMRHLTKDTNGNTIESDADVYKAPAVPVSGSVPDVYTGTDDVTLTIPDSVTSVDDYAAIAEANPSDIISYEKAIEYPDGVPKVDSSGLFDKFPFCLPVDIYNMITGFYAPAEAPRYVIPIKLFPQNDGYLIDYSLVVDFNFLDPVIPIIRYGTSFIFIVGLILITRKMIGAQ